MRLLICAGGTGGGVYPALSVLETLKQEGERMKALDPLWVGGVGGMEESLVLRAGVPYTAIPAAGVHGVGPRALPGNLAQLARGFREARRVLLRFHPDVLFFTGGYLAVPMALASQSLGRRGAPALLYVPDIEPGLALQTLARLATCVAVSTPDSPAYFAPTRTWPARPRVEVTGYPTRPGLEAWSRETGQQFLNLDPNLPSLLVFGGSKGARSLNRALLASLEGLLAEMQVVHISGQLDWPEVEAAQARLNRVQAARYRAYPYLHEMGAALSAADLVISRAGASSLGEYPLFGLPAILVPYPYAWRYQQVNAQYLARYGAARVLDDASLPDRLLPEVRSLMGNPGQRAAMQAAMRSLARPQAAAAIAQLLRDLAGDRGKGRVP